MKHTLIITAILILVLSMPTIAGSGNADMVLIGSGKAILGAASIHALPGPKAYHVAAFNIDRFEVTHAQYMTFVRATGHKPPAFADDPAFNKHDQPVTGVTWGQAQAYCHWAGKRLPSEIEWEKAARGTDGRLYPWGQGYNASHAHLSGETPVAVSAFMRDESPYKVHGMAGNVSEWVSDRRTARAGVCGKGHHHHNKTAGHSKHMVKNSKPKMAAMTTAPHVKTSQCAFIKGNSWSGRPHMTKLHNRMWDYVLTYAEFVGFRCAADVRQNSGTRN